jgi:hypothetical protein
MFRTALAVAVSSAALGLAVPAQAPPAAATSASAPVAGLSVSGTGVGMYPAFDADVERYEVITTTGKTGGTGRSTTGHQPIPMAGYG